MCVSQCPLLCWHAVYCGSASSVWMDVHCRWLTLDRAVMITSVSTPTSSRGSTGRPRSSLGHAMVLQSICGVLGVSLPSCWLADHCLPARTSLTRLPASSRLLAYLPRELSIWGRDRQTSLPLMAFHGKFILSYPPLDNTRVMVIVWRLRGLCDTMFTVSSTLIWAVLAGPADWVCHIGTLMPCIEAVA